MPDLRFDRDFHSDYHGTVSPVFLGEGFAEGILGVENQDVGFSEKSDVVLNSAGVEVFIFGVAGINNSSAAAVFKAETVTFTGMGQFMGSDA